MLNATASALPELALSALSTARHHHHHIDPTTVIWTRDSIGALCGWASIGTWIVVFMPQIVENYWLKSGEGLSLVFLAVWLAGDFLGFAGAALQHLSTTIQGLALYFASADIVLLVQVLWYRRRRRLHPELYSISDAGASHITNPEQEALVGAAEHSGYGTNATSATLSSKPRRFSQSTRSLMLFIAALIFIVAFAFGSWDAERTAERARGGHHQRPAEVWDTQAQVIGWASAALYLGARLPQIRKNGVTKCAGLSLAFFFLSLLGNITYSASILVPSLDRDHIVLNASWLVGSAGTLVLDFFVLGQFYVYRHARRELMEKGGTPNA